MTVHMVRNGCSSTVRGLCQWQASDGEGVQRPHRFCGPKAILLTSDHEWDESNGKLGGAQCASNLCFGFVILFTFNTCTHLRNFMFVSIQ